LSKPESWTEILVQPENWIGSGCSTCSKLNSAVTLMSTFICTIRLILFINFSFIRFCFISIWRSQIFVYRIIVVAFIMSEKCSSFQNQFYHAWFRSRTLFASKSRWDIFWLHFHSTSRRKLWSKWIKNQTCFE
jgi:hypothetical protein